MSLNKSSSGYLIKNKLMSWFKHIKRLISNSYHRSPKCFLNYIKLTFSKYNKKNSKIFQININFYSNKSIKILNKFLTPKILLKKHSRWRWFPVYSKPDTKNNRGCWYYQVQLIFASKCHVMTNDYKNLKFDYVTWHGIYVVCLDDKA